MSGHSKWHNIQKTKGAADAKRSAAFTKIAKEIIVAVKEGGGSGDPANNSRLATVIAKAKAVNMPNDNIKRTIDKALGAGNTENFEAVTYEGYGPGGVAVIVDALTDNRQRTAPEVRHAFDKCNGNLGAQGCVSWSFDRKGVIVIDNEDQELDEDTVMMDALEAGAADFECAAAAWVKKTLNEHRRVIFNGNGYTAEWEAEAAKRGLPNKKNTPAALPALIDPKNIALMEEFGVLTKTEMLSRYEVEMEHYSKIINIEARTMLKIASKQLIPAATSYMGEVASTAAAKIAAVEGISTKSEAKLLTALSKYTDEMSDATDALKAVTDKVSALDDETAKAHAFHDEVLPAMDTLRAAADAAEELVDEDYWPLPCYSRMLFYTE